MEVLEPGPWNVRTLLDTTTASKRERTLLVAKALVRYSVDIAALGETRQVDKGQLTKHGGGHTFFCSDRSSDEHCGASVRFATRSQLVKELTKLFRDINDCLVSLLTP